MTTTSTSTPLLINNIDALRNKLSDMPQTWQRRWQRFCNTAKAERRIPRWYGSGGGGGAPLHAAFAWLINQDQTYLDIAKRDVMYMLDNYEATLDVGAQEQDTWIYAAPMARRAIALDWIWHSGAFSDAEKARIQEHFITDSLKYPYIVLHHRVPPHANNQGLAMAMNCCIVGYLFGERLAKDARAKHLLEFAMPHLLQQIALLPPGGYSGEGSTYIASVADPLMAVSCAFLEAITGETWLKREFAPSGNSPLATMDLTPRLTVTSGVLPGMDQHGYQLATAGTTMAFLADRLNDPAIYNTFVRGHGWDVSGHFAWLEDDHVWQWIWMPTPEEPNNQLARCFPYSWLDEHVAGALRSGDGQHHCFQWWDVSADRPVRLHMNPNSLELQAWGSLLTVDGNAADNYPLNQDPRMQYTSYYSETPEKVSWAAGTLAAHSVITVDGDDALTVPHPGYENHPKDVRTGQGFGLVDTPALKVMRADVSRFYDHAYDIKHMVRSTALIDDTAWVVRDDITSETDHDYRWQLVLRQGAQQTDYGQRLSTAEHVTLDIFHLDGCDTTLEDVPGYPTTLETTCHHLQKTMRGNEATFLTVLVPQLGRKDLMALSDFGGAWSDSEDQRPDTFNPFDISRTVDTVVAEQRKGQYLWLHSTITLPEAGEHPRALKLSRPYPCTLWVNGEALDIPLPVYKKSKQHLMPPYVTLPEGLAGEVTIDIRYHVNSERGLIDAMGIVETISPAVPDVTRNGDTISITLDGKTHTVHADQLKPTDVPEPQTQARGEDDHAAAQATLSLVVSDTLDSAGDFGGNDLARLTACTHALKQPLAQVEADLIQATRDDNWLVRQLAARALGIHKSSAAIERLCEMLQEETAEKVADITYRPRYRVKEMAVFALGEIGDPRACDALCAIMHHDEFYGVRRIGAQAIGKLGNPAAIATLEQWTNDNDGETANAAKRSLATLKKLTER